MQKRPLIYLIGLTDLQVESLKIVLHLVGEAFQLLSLGNLKEKIVASEPLCVIYNGSGDQFKDLTGRFPDSAFIYLGKQEVCVANNYIGDLILPSTYADIMQLLYRCQAFLNPKHKLKSMNKLLVKSLVGKGPRIQEIRYLVEQVADSKANVLILGESGTGKEVVARAIHEVSQRKGGPFVPVNCGAIPAELLESELFGHEKGAFTGAYSARKGRFELAAGGTLFLDEIGDMPMPMQVKLLRVLQERVFERVGGSKSLQADVRIVAATHRNLEEMIVGGDFREDLFYRLNVFPIEKPALRERQEDIPLLVQELLSRLADEHHATLRFTQEALSALMQYAWPGNIRELSNLLERLLILHGNKIIDVTELPLKYQTPMSVGEITQSIQYNVEDEALMERDALCGMFGDVTLDQNDNETLSEPVGFLENLPENGLNLKDKLVEFEIEMIRQAIESQDGVVSHAAELLSMRRTTLVEKMKKYGLSKESG